ncbi:AAA-like domain-containing protein [Nostoc sp. DedQUE07]|uniref:AAA-like domain-containing protein n=1 Tax=Nostoc sp. DedQUE07 TaxID=3075392 RepID=UPI002AD293F5|nr:AAA-like domain-containing protein [Nostoc sp. DedQUE07]MDZ8130027.1 AAA-like domain-containing protein [Nostoc sp. DedQUE07]
MGRSVRVAKQFITKVKNAVKRQGYPRCKDLAEDAGISLSTVSNFLNGRPVDYLNFIELCDRLGQDWKTIQDTNSNESEDTFLCEDLVQIENDSEEVGFIYVERPPIEETCYQTLLQPGSLLRIKAPGLRGKTSLMAKILPQLMRKGYRTVCLNLHYAETSLFTNLEKLLQWFCVSVGKSLGMPNRLGDYWDAEFSSPKMNCKEYFEKYLLTKSASPLVLCLDEVERIFPYQEVASDFLGLLRAWHEEARIFNIWKKLRLVVVHSTEVYIPLEVNESPFNVGVPIDLPDFNSEQVHHLAQQHGLDWDLQLVNQLMTVVGGHPYLVGEAFSFLKVNRHFTLEKLLQTAVSEAGIYSNHLRRYWCLIEQYPELAEALKEVVMATDEVRLPPMQAYKLHSMGLVHLRGNEVTIGCNLYRKYFSDRFGLIP